MRRVALLPTSGQTHIIGFWFKMFERWQSEVDKLYIHVNNTSHGKSLRHMMKKYVRPDDLVMFIEDDGIIFKPGIVDDCFSKIEKGKFDLLGSPRMSCHPELVEASKKKYNLDYSGEGDKGPNWWPNFFFCKAEHLFKTDLHFEDYGFKKGDFIKELDHTVENDVLAADTFVWGSMQLRAMGLKVGEIPQYHSSPYDLEHSREKKGIFDGKASWFHLGSLTGDFSRPTNDEITMRELCRRAMWHQLCGRDICEIVKQFRLDKSMINKLRKLYTNLLYE